MATHPLAEREPLSEPTSDSYQELLADVMKEIDDGLSMMPEDERIKAVADIHTIAEDVRLRQARSSGR